MLEPVRLVIWDLDETFWHGTLTEGGITFRPELREMVIELARRGIVSSICSKNDFDPVKDILVANDVWQYFVFPSINWEPKGPRLAAMVETVQLRAPTIMFIDDNPLNLAEAGHYLPEMQVRDHLFVKELLADPLFKGKADPEMTRLAQYKAMERRKVDEVGAGADTSAFLRSSGVRVSLNYDLVANIDRVVELINRTNQLNFTKRRLPEAAEAARAEALRLVSGSSIQGALVKVRDNYGDHGYCGLYLYDSEERRLRQFCFSCRVLGMGIEQWLYNQLGRPHIAVQGEVLSDLFDQSKSYDWVTIEPLEGSERETRQSPHFAFEAVTARGGCETGAIMHYFATAQPNVQAEYNIHRNGSTFRIDHSIFLKHAIDGVGSEQMLAAQRLGFVEDDFKTRVFDRFGDGHLVVLSFTADAMHALYRHRKTGIVLPFMYPGCNPMLDLRDTDPVKLAQTPWMIEALAFLRDEWDFIGPIGEAEFSANLYRIFSSIPAQTDVVVIEANECFVNWDTGDRSPANQYARPNAWARNAAAHFPNIFVLAASQFIESKSDLPMLHGQHDIIHYDRRVYFRMYEHIAGHYAARMESLEKELAH